MTFSGLYSITLLDVIYLFKTTVFLRALAPISNVSSVGDINSGCCGFNFVIQCDTEIGD